MRYCGYERRRLLLINGRIEESTSALLTFVGSHARALTAFLPSLFNVKLSFLVLTSQTVTNPPLLPVTKICGTTLFQSRHSKSSALAADLPKRNGLPILLRSEMNNLGLISGLAVHGKGVPYLSLRSCGR